MWQNLFTPWRLEYVSSAEDLPRDECVFCQAYASTNDRSTHTLFRGERVFSLLNRYPYTSGHSMVAPIVHTDDVVELDDETLTEIVLHARRLVEILRGIYRPHGFNLGFNVGEAAGAGIEEHLHLHIVPRWRGDNNLMGVIGTTRVIPEALDETYSRVRAALVDGVGRAG